MNGLGEYLSFAAFWLLIMALIGGALKLVAVIGAKKAAENKEKTENIQDIADE